MATTQDTTERWKPIPGYEERYEVSTLGRVRSLDRLVYRQTGLQRSVAAQTPGRLLVPKISKYGERIVLLYKGSRTTRKMCTIHRLVLLAFVGAPSPHYAANHKDGDRSNNRLDNLEWVSYQENRHHYLDILKPQRSDGPQNPNRLAALQRPRSHRTSPKRKPDNTPQNLDGEIWRDIQGYEGLYMVSHYGRVKSLGRAVGIHPLLGGTRQPTAKLLRSGTVGRYARVALCKDGQISYQSVHHLVLEAFLRPRPPGMQGCHNDGNHRNNHLDNLRWDTPGSNAADRILHGSNASGSRNGNSKLTEAEVVQIRLMLNDNIDQWTIARLFNVHQGTISSIKTGGTWNNITLKT